MWIHSGIGLCIPDRTSQCCCRVGPAEASCGYVQVAFLDAVHGSALLNLGSTQVRHAVLDSWCV